MAIELAPHNIQVNAIAPGWIETNMTAPVRTMPLNDEILTGTPAGRWGQPEELAGTAVYLGLEGVGLRDWNYDSCRWRLCNPMTRCISDIERNITGGKSIYQQELICLALLPRLHRLQIAESRFEDTRTSSTPYGEPQQHNRKQKFPTSKA
jgi:hypothetical protein